MNLRSRTLAFCAILALAPCTADAQQWHAEDVVAYEVPQAVVTFARHLSPSMVGAVGLGRYGLKGAFAEPIDYAERLFFAGVQVRQSAKASLLATFRRTAFSGITTFPASPRAPTFTGSALIVEQRYAF